MPSTASAPGDAPGGLHAGMRIDAHVHLWRYRAEEFPWITAGMGELARDRLAADLLPLLRDNGVDGGIAVQARASAVETEWLLAQAAAHPHLVGVVGWADPTSPAVGDVLERWRAMGPLVGVRAMVQDAPDPAALLADAGFHRGVAAVQAQGLAYDLLVRAPDLGAAVEFCHRRDRQWIVLDHAGKPNIRHGAWDAWVAHIAALAAMPHVVCKLSGLVTEAASPAQALPYGRHVLEAFGADRVMFGSDWPVCTLAATYDQVCALADAVLHGASGDDRAAVYGGTASRCYGLARRSPIGPDTPWI